ncbi:MAG: protein kinase [Polyangiaceae bacterium]|nr:protein kinase [Polyangiaceae bacterium]
MARSAAPGSLIGKYTVLRLLAVGGSAEVYLVRSHGIEGFAKLAVLKRLLPHLVGHPDFVEMFLDEARLAANLHHPNIAQIYDFGRSGQSHYLTMEYVEGESLSNVIRSAAGKKRGFSLGNSLRVVQSVAAGLHYAHQLKDADGKPLGIVHRDVSPHNVMVTFDGSVKLVDFGIATAHSSKNQALPGSIRGSLRYMSPEQCAGEPLDCRSDLFSLGVLLFELTTGTRFHRESDDGDVVRRILDGPTPMPSSRREDYPPELERIVMTALERERSRRYSTAQELQVDLESFGQAQGVLTSNVALAEFMREIFGERRFEARTTPAAAAARVDSADPSASAPSGPAAPVRRGWRWVGAVLTLACLTGLILLWFGSSRRHPSTRRSSAQPEASATAPAPPPLSVQAAPQAPEGPRPRAAASGQAGAGSARTGPTQARPRPRSAKHLRNTHSDPSGMVPATSAPAASPKPSAPWTLDSPLPP